MGLCVGWQVVIFLLRLLLKNLKTVSAGLHVRGSVRVHASLNHSQRQGLSLKNWPSIVVSLSLSLSLCSAAPLSPQDTSNRTHLNRFEPNQQPQSGEGCWFGFHDVSGNWVVTGTT